MDTPRRKQRNEETKRRVNSGCFSLQNSPNKRLVDQVDWIQNSSPIECHRIFQATNIHARQVYGTRQLVKLFENYRDRKKMKRKCLKLKIQKPNNSVVWQFFDNFFDIQFVRNLSEPFDLDYFRQSTKKTRARGSSLKRQYSQQVSTVVSHRATIPSPETKRMVRGEPVLISCGW